MSARCFFAVILLTWRKWGNPEIDAGAELSTADLVAHGSVPYEDVRYFYGPLGLYSLAATFKLFGASFTVAYAFGLAQAGAILGVFYALARRWLPPATAGLATAVLLAIGFSGTAFNFVLPHTNSATFGCLFRSCLLALTRGRLSARGFRGRARGPHAARVRGGRAGVVAACVVGPAATGVRAACRAALDRGAGARCRAASRVLRRVVGAARLLPRTSGRSTSFGWPASGASALDALLDSRAPSAWSGAGGLRRRGRGRDRVAMRRRERRARPVAALERSGRGLLLLDVLARVTGGPPNNGLRSSRRLAISSSG